MMKEELFEVSMKVSVQVKEKDIEFARLKAEKLLGQCLIGLDRGEIETLSVDKK